MLLNNSPLKNTSEKLKSPQTSIKTLKIERKKDFKSFLKYVEKESKALEDIKLPSLNEARNKKSSLLGSALGLGALGLLAFFAGGDGEGDPNDQPNKFDYFDPEAFKRTLNTQTRIASLSYTGMKAANFFDDGGGKGIEKGSPKKPPLVDFKNTIGGFTFGLEDKEFDTGVYNKVGQFDQFYRFPVKYKPKDNILKEAFSEIDMEMYDVDTEQERRIKKIERKIIPLRRKALTINDDIDYSKIGTDESIGFKDPEKAFTKINKKMSEGKKTNFSIGRASKGTIKQNNVVSNFLGADAEKISIYQEFSGKEKEEFKQILDDYKKPQKNKFQKFFDTGVPRLFARGALTLLNIGGKVLQIEPLISPVLSPDAFEEGTMTSVMDVFGNMPGDPNFDEDSKGIYSDYMVINEAAMKEMRQIKINYLTRKMMTGEIETPDLTRGLDFNNFSVPSGAFQPPTEGNSDSVIPFILPEEPVGSSVLDSLILLELERY